MIKSDDTHDSLPRSLIICLTPLQMIIAKRIVSNNPNKSFDLIVIALDDNEKFRYYYDDLKLLCCDYIYCKDMPGILNLIRFSRLLKKNNLDKNYSELYVASINDRRIQYIVSKNNKADVYTYDDGTANINTDSIYYSNEKPNIAKRLVWYFLGMRSYTAGVRARSKLHYTIYMNIPNIINKTEFIELYPVSHSSCNVIKNSVKLFLGQPVDIFYLEMPENYIKNVLNTLEIDYYFPHPREIDRPAGNFKVISSKLIFEDFIINYLKDNPFTEVEVYSFLSGSCLNIIDLDRTKVYFIRNSMLDKTYANFYSTIEKFDKLYHLYIEN